MVTVGIVSPGAMGSALGARLRTGGADTVASVADRSARTQSLAAGAGFAQVSFLDELVAACDVVLSVVPPGEAEAVARAIAAAAQRTAARPLVADLNAISPGTVARLAEVLSAAGLDLVDGAISGPPPLGPVSTRLYLSGGRAAEIESLPLPGVERTVVGASVGLASAVKMCTASVYKGRVALLAQALRTARAHGVLDYVLDDLVVTGLADRERTGETLARASTKAWRYVAEMEEIATTQDAAGLDPALFSALAQVYAELAALAPSDRAPEEIEPGAGLVEVLDGLAPPRPARP